MGFPRSAIKVLSGQVPAYRAGSTLTTKELNPQFLPTSVAILARAFQSLALSAHLRSLADSHMFTIPTFQRLPGYVITRRVFLSRFIPRIITYALPHCRGCSLFKPLDSPSGIGGSLFFYKSENNSYGDIVSHGSQGIQGRNLTLGRIANF